MDLVKNQLFQWRHEEEACIERVLWVEHAGPRLVTIDVMDKKAWPSFVDRAFLEHHIASGDICLLDSDMYGYLRQPDEAFSPFHIERREKAWRVIEDIVDPQEEGIGEPDDGAIYHSRILGPLVQAAMKKTGCSKQWVYTCLRHYWQRGQMKNALLPQFDRCGAQGRQRKSPESHAPKRGRPSKTARLTGVSTGVNIDDTIKEYFRRGTKLFYETPEKMPMTEAFERILARFFHRGKELRNGILVPILPPSDELPTLNQYRYWYEKERDFTHSIIAREGLRAFNLRGRAVLERLRQRIPGPGFLFEIDATVGDVYLVSMLNRRHIIGRPVIYVIVDVFSGLIVGMSVSLKGPSWEGAMLALENMALDKVAFCKEYGFDIAEDDWPSHHLPKAILADRGELLSKHADNLASALDIQVSNTPPYRPDWKGYVERSFRTLNDMIIHWEPGSVKNLPEPGRKDHRLDACLTLYDFRRLMIDCIIEHNTAHRLSDDYLDSDMIADEVEPYPRDLWKWGVQNRSGVLHTLPIDVVRWNLLPRTKASVTREGIYFHKMHYTCERAIREQWFEQVRRGSRHGEKQGRKRSWSIPIAYDPRTSDYIYLPPQAGQQLETRTSDQFPRGEQQLEICTLLEKDKAKFEGCDWFDVEDYHLTRYLSEKAAETRDRQSRVEHRVMQECITEEARRKTSEAREEGETKAERLNIRESRAADEEHERKTHPWEFQEQKASSPGKEVKPSTTKDRRVAMLERLQDGETKHV